MQVLHLNFFRLSRQERSETTFFWLSTQPWDFYFVPPGSPPN